MCRTRVRLFVALVTGHNDLAYFSSPCDESIASATLQMRPFSQDELLQFAEDPRMEELLDEDWDDQEEESEARMDSKIVHRL